MDACLQLDRPSDPVQAAAPLPFAWVGSGHPWEPMVQRLREAIAAAGGRVAGARVQAELKGVRAADGSWVLERAYWSLQQADARAPLGLRSHTLSADLREAGRPRIEWLRLPHDPYLGAVPGWLDRRGPRESVRILRYVPLRRLTFRCTDVEGRHCIGKFKRRSRFGEAYALLEQVDAAVRACEQQQPAPGFRVAAPIALLAPQALYFQSCLPGSDLAERMGEADALAWMRALGQRQQRLQGLATRGLPLRTPERQHAQARTDLAWIAWMRPGLADALRPLATAVERVPCWRDEDLGFCHGDLVCSQFLVPAGGPEDPQPWGITDFDLCHRGDPCRDLAILLASLDEDVALLAPGRTAGVDADALAEACLEGARAEAARRGQRAPDAQRLRWQRLCAEIYYLGLMLKKDRHQPELFARRLARALRLASTGGRA